MRIDLSFIIIIILLCSCNGAKNRNEEQNSTIMAINADFPTSEDLEFEYFNDYEMLETGYLRITDSALWHFTEMSRTAIGSCYDLNTGEKISTIGTRGKAKYEFVRQPSVLSFIGDSIQFTCFYQIKTFSIKDIIENKSLDSRGYSIVDIPSSFAIKSMTKLPDGSIFTRLGSPVGTSQTRNDLNKNSIVIINGDDVKSYDLGIDYERFGAKEWEMNTGGYKDATYSDDIKNIYATGYERFNDDNIIVLSVLNQFTLYSFDINSGKVLKEKTYTIPEESGGGYPENNLRLSISGDMKADSKYIYCPVEGYFSEKDKKNKKRRTSIFIFDWDLNPIKRFNLPYTKNETIIISEDCKSVYAVIDKDNGCDFKMYKAKNFNVN